MWGPCVYESASNDDYLVNTEKCMQESRPANWKKMSVEEPEQKRETGLPDWLKVGNFVWLDAGFMSIKNPKYQGVPRGIYKIISIKSDSLSIESIHDRGNGYFKIPWGDADEIQRLSMRPVYPKLYTFETAPLSMKVRRRADGKNDILRLGINHSTESFLSLSKFAVVSFYEALRDYEQVDGWPCGTFDGEDEK